MNNNDCRRLDKNIQRELRIRATQAALDNPKTPKTKIAEMFGISSQALSKWMKKVSNNRRRGIDCLNDDNRGQDDHNKKLSTRQLNAVEELIQKYTPDHFKLPYLLWIREAVQDLIKQRYGVNVSMSKVSWDLKVWGMTPKKPAKEAKEQNPKEVNKWLKKEYPEIKKKAKEEKAEIHWVDESKIQSDHILRIKRRRFSCNMISSITNAGKLRFMIYGEKFTSGTFIKFLTRLTQEASRKIFLVADNHSAHKSREVKEWLDKNKDKMEIFYLPRYSPDLNPDELVNKQSVA